MPFSVYQTNGICDILPCQNTVRPNCASRFFYTDEERESFCRLEGDPPLRAQVCPKRGVSPRGGPWLGSFFCPFRGGYPPQGGGGPSGASQGGPLGQETKKGLKGAKMAKKGCLAQGVPLVGHPLGGGPPPFGGVPLRSQDDRDLVIPHYSRVGDPPLKGGP